MRLPTEYKITTPKVIYQYRKIDEDAIGASFRGLASTCVSDIDKRRVEANWNMLKTEFKRLKSSFISKIVLKTNSQRPGLSNVAKRFFPKKKRLFSKEKLSDSTSYWSSYNQCYKEYKL